MLYLLWIIGWLYTFRIMLLYKPINVGIIAVIGMFVIMFAIWPNIMACIIADYLELDK